MSQGDRVAEVKPPSLLGNNFYVCEDIRFSLSNKLDTWMSSQTVSHEVYVSKYVICPSSHLASAHLVL